MLGTRQRLWVNELMNGGRKQTQGCLQMDDCYCCLGVACVALQTKTLEPRFFEIDTEATCEIELDGDDLDWQPEIHAALGLRCTSGSPDGTNPLCDKLVAHCNSLSPDGILTPSECTLTRLNDDEGFSFKQIAEVLCKFPSLYFLEPR